MKKSLLIGILAFAFCSGKAQYTINDTAFATNLNAYYPWLMTGNVLDTIQAVNVTDLFLDGYGVADLDGLQYFTGLRWLLCENNQLTQLPDLPDSLLILHCHNNDLTSLPDLPGVLGTLFAHGNELTYIPTLPDSLINMACGNNQLTALPELPSKLWYLNCSDNAIDCLPELPNSLEWFDCINTNVTCLPNVPLDFDFVQSDLDFPASVCDFSSPCPIFDELITGSVFLDTNGNGLKDIGEGPFTSAVVEAQPGDFLTVPDSSGNYVLHADTGTFTLDGQDVLYYDRTTNPVIINLGSLQMDSLNDIGYQAIPGIYDLVVYYSVGFPRPGKDNTNWLGVINIGTESTTANIDLIFDADQTWSNSSIIPDSQVGNTASWTTSLAPGQSWQNAVYLHTDQTVPLGTPIQHIFSAIPQMTDTTPVNNTDTINTVVVGSWDPNNKLNDPSAMLPLQVLNGEYIEYTINFQNTGTAAAERVVITDTLSTDLDWGSMEYISGSHDNTWFLQNGILHFIHDPIFLPDSNSNEPESHGYVKFRMKPVGTLIAGETIENVANIYFDFNEPVITDPAVFEVSISTEIAEYENADFEIYPNPTNGNVTIMSSDQIERIEVHLLDGRSVQSNAGNSNIVFVDVSALARGTYIVSVKYNQGLSKSQLLLIQ